MTRYYGLMRDFIHKIIQRVAAKFMKTDIASAAH